jgi:hypothetical protein
VSLSRAPNKNIYYLLFGRLWLLQKNTEQKVV